MCLLHTLRLLGLWDFFLITFACRLRLVGAVIFITILVVFVITGIELQVVGVTAGGGKELNIF